MRNRIIRFAVYLYFSAGMALLLGANAASIVRFAPEKGFALGYLVVLGAAIFAVLSLSSWDSHARTMDVRKWTILCAIASIGFVASALLTRISAGSAV